MPWPFSNVGAPNLDTGPGVAVPEIAADVTAGQAWLMGGHFTNTDAATRTITVTSAAGTILCELAIPPGAEQPYEWPFRPTVGITWVADGPNVVGHLWGYE